MSALTINQPKIKLHGDTMTTTSLNVAEVFNRNHRDVTRKIESLDIPESFNQRNFTRVEYKDAKGEIRKAYEITRDGFTLLAMGFTGKKAMTFKLGYIEAFNVMECELLQKYQQVALPQTITPKQKLSIRDAMAKKVYDNYGKKMVPVGFKNEWHDFYEAFEISKYEELPANRFDDAMAYLLGEWVPEETTPAITSDMVMVNKTNLEALLKLNAMSANIYNQRIQEIERMTTELSASVSDFRMRSWDAVRDGAWVAKTLGKEIAENSRCI